MRLFISGISGIGKTTLAKTISQEFDIPFVIGSTKLIWEKYGIKSHKEIISMCNNQPKMGMKFQKEVLDYRLEMINSHESFVSDRSPVDNIVYVLTQLAHLIDEKEVTDYIDKCKIVYNIENVRHIHLAAGINTIHTTPLENDNMRITNMYYQLMINSIFDLVIKDNWLLIPKDNFRYIETWDMATRKKAAKELIVKLKYK